MNIDETVEKIKNLEIQGAQNIAIEGLTVLKEIASEKGFGKDFEEAAKKLEGARPTGVSIHNCIKYVREEKSIEAIDKTLRYLDEAKKKVSEYASQLVEDGDIIMTHCHSSTVISTLKEAKKQGKDFKVIVTETEPKLQGLKTAKDLVKMDIPVYYVVDSSAALFMWITDSVFVGVDSVKFPGVLNKIGTYQISIAAKEDPETKFYFVATKDKFDYDNFSTIETRSPKEIRNYKELKDPDIILENPAFDMTPWSHITELVTENGIMKKHEIMDVLGDRFEVE